MSTSLQESVADTCIDVFVDQITTAGSAFGSTYDSGEAVFIHARIVDYLSLRHGDKLRAWVMPNYPDKRHNVPLRVLRAEVQGSIFEDISTEVQDAHDEDLEPVDVPTELEPDMELEGLSNADKLVALLEAIGPLRTSYIAKELDLSMTDAATFCYGLQQEGKLVRADVYSHPSNKRASLRIWALGINDFDEEYAEYED
tara:strand:+ start:2190 stop:2786 length:597 start_codon:yes stop_codon:yes gene_type:complete